MDSLWINAPAKINLGLDVIRRREDGYHEVKMIMQSIRLFDRLTLAKSKNPGIHLTTNLNFLPVNEDNLVYKSAKLLMEKTHPHSSRYGRRKHRRRFLPAGYEPLI